MTLDRYAHVTALRRRDAAARCEALLAGAAAEAPGEERA
jgi:hypothetical protein